MGLHALRLLHMLDSPLILQPGLHSKRQLYPCTATAAMLLP